MSDPTAAHNHATESSDPSSAGPESIPELTRLGEQLRQARQSRGLGVEELAERIHIGSDQLLALESGDRTRLPEAVFVIAQAKRVASVLGIDVEGSIAQVRQSRLMQQTARPTLAPPPPSPARSPAGRAAAGAARPAPPSPGSQGPGRSRLPIMALLATMAAVAAAFALLQARRAPTSSSPAPAPQLSAPPTPTPQPQPQPAQSDSRPASPNPGAADELVLRASEISWIEVRTLAGQRLFEGNLEGEKRFPIGKGLEVMAGRPYAVTAAMGEQTPRPLGRVDEFVWRRFIPAGAPAP